MLCRAKRLTDMFCKDTRDAPLSPMTSYLLDRHLPSKCHMLTTALKAAERSWSVKLHHLDPRSRF